MAVVVTGLAELQRDLLRAAATPAVRPILERSKNMLVSRLQQEATGRKTAPRLPQAITGNLFNGGTGYEVGPRRGGPGSLAFKYYGNSKVNAVLPDPIIALHAEADRVTALMAAALVRDLSA